MSKRVYRNKGSKDNIVISIAGAHGVGKSTVFSILKKKTENDPKFKFFPERYVQNPPFPFGSSNKQVAFRSEIHFLQQFIKRNRSIWNYDERYNGRIIILDRTPICVLIYSKSLSLKEKDYHLILDTYNSINWREDHIIYLYAEPEVILKRILHRGSLDEKRKEWNEYEKNYLLDILTFYKQMLLSKNDKIHMVNTDKKTPEQTSDEVLNIIENLSGYSLDKVNNVPRTQMDLTKFLK